MVLGFYLHQWVAAVSRSRSVKSVQGLLLAFQDGVGDGSIREVLKLALVWSHGLGGECLLVNFHLVSIEVIFHNCSKPKLTKGRTEKFPSYTHSHLSSDRCPNQNPLRPMKEIKGFWITFLKHLRIINTLQYHMFSPSSTRASMLTIWISKNKNNKKKSNHPTFNKSWAITCTCTQKLRGNLVILMSDFHSQFTSSRILQVGNAYHFTR